MIPILYEKDETTFSNNGLCRLRSCTSAGVSEERNGIYELDFEYPVDGANYELITIGRIIGVTHDESDDIQPFDIVSYEKPIDGIVTFHAVHISYRQSYLTVTGKNINSLASAFTLLGNSTPTNPFTYQTDKTSTGYLASADGVPKTVRQMLGGVEGSILDAYGGEYEWDRFNVILHSARGVDRDFSIRYGVNMTDYNEELDSSGCYMACVPYWTDGTVTVVGDKQTASGTTITNRGECVPLDVSDKFENKPTKAQVNAMGLSMINSNNPMVPGQNIHVEFIRLQDSPEYAGFASLLQCRLCDTINVVFPNYNTQSRFKIVKTVWDVLQDRYESMELGDLSVTLAEALGISDSQNGKATRSYFYANSVTATAISSTSTPTKVPITGISTASGFEYDSTNKGIKCTEAGTYMISVQQPFNPATSGDLIGLSIYKNGVQAIGVVYARMGGTYDAVVISPTIIVLAEGDYLTLYAQNNTASRGQTQTATRFSAWKVD